MHMSRFGYSSQIGETRWKAPHRCRGEAAMTSATLLPNDQSKVCSKAWLKAQKIASENVRVALQDRGAADVLHLISSDRTLSAVPNSTLSYSDALLISSYLRDHFTMFRAPLVSAALVKVLLYTLDASAAEGSCSSTVTVPDISVET